MAVYKIDSRNGITFFKPDWPFLDPQNDVGTNCGLSVAEMNNNFYVLESRDVVSFTLEHNHIKLKLMGGVVYEIDLSHLCNGANAVRYTSDGSIIINGSELSTRGAIIPWMRPLNDEENNGAEVEYFTVTNPVGSYQNGWRIPCNESLTTVLQTMLSGKIKAQHQLPTFDLILQQNVNGVWVPIKNNLITVECGTEDIFNAYFLYDENTEYGGCYVGQWYKPNGKELAKCEGEEISYNYGPGSEETVETKPKDTTKWEKNIDLSAEDGWEEGVNELELSFKYKTSTVIPKDSDNKDNENNIITWDENNKDMFKKKVRIETRYRFFYGFVESNKSEDDIIFDNPDTMVGTLTENQGNNWCEFDTDTKKGVTKIKNIEAKDRNKSTIVLVLPEEYELLSVINRMGSNVPETFTLQKNPDGTPYVLQYRPKNISGTLGKTIPYHIYFTSGLLEPTKYEEISFTKNEIL